MSDENKTEVGKTEVESVVEASETKDETAAKPENKAEQPKPWYEGRIDTLAAQKGEALKAIAERDARLALSEAANEALQKKIKALEKGDGGETEPRGERMVPASKVKEEAERLTAAQMRERDFNVMCNTMVDEGKKTHKDFLDKVQTEFSKIGGLSPVFLEIAHETGHGAELMYKLAGDLDSAAEVLALSPTRMAARLTKMANEIKPPAVSSAPAPIETINSRSASGNDSELRDDLSMDEWMKRRERQVEESRKVH